MSANLFDIHHSNGPAPAYAVESDSEEDEWADDPRQGLTRSTPDISPNHAQDNPQFMWRTGRPQLEFPNSSTLLVLVGDAGSLVASGLPEALTSQSQTFHQLDDYLLVSDFGRYVLSPRHVPLQLQTSLATKLLSDLRPPSLTIVSSYAAPTYIPSSEQYPIRYLLSSFSAASSNLPSLLEGLGCQHFQVPNLIKGFEAALMIQANILKIESRIVVLPSISTPHDDKSSKSIPAGQYDFSTSSTDNGHDLPSSLLGIDDHNLRCSIKAVIEKLILTKNDPQNHRWEFPSKLSPSIKHLVKQRLHLNDELKQKSIGNQPPAREVGLMYL